MEKSYRPSSTRHLPPRWQCQRVQLTPHPVSSADWQERLATAAEALYSLKHQLQDAPRPFPSGNPGLIQSSPLLPLIPTENPVVPAVDLSAAGQSEEEEGACHGDDFEIQKAS